MHIMSMFVYCNLTYWVLLSLEGQLDFSYYVVPTATSNARFGEGIGPIWLDNVGCRGTEDSLFSCHHNGVGYHNCVHSEDAGVICRGEL